jgi:hypothetical protein
VPWLSHAGPAIQRPPRAPGARSGRAGLLTLPVPLRFPLAFDGKLLGQVLRIFTDTVSSWYRKRHVGRGLPAGESGAVTAIQRANSDLHLNPHFHTLFLDAIYGPDREGARNARGVGRGRCGPEVPEGGDGHGLMFHPAPAPTQEDIEQLVARASRRDLRFLQRRGVITLVTAPGDGEVTVVADETLGEQDPLLARVLAAATIGAAPAGPATKRRPVRIVPDRDERPVAKGDLCASAHGFNLHAATRVAANDKPGRERLCRYILRPPLANDRLHILPEGAVRLDFKKPWSDGTASVDLEPLAFIASHSLRGSRPLRFIALIKTSEVIVKILVAVHLSADAPELHPARPTPGAGREAGDGEEWLN